MTTTQLPAERHAAGAEHSRLAPLAFLLSMAIPAVIAIVGVLALGAGEIDWVSAIVWGIVATVALSAFGVMGKAIGMTRMDIFELLGSWLAPPGTARARLLGIGIHHMNGALLAIGWAYAVALVDLPANWATGLAWGVVLTLLTYLMMSSVGSVHPAIRRGGLDDPGLLMPLMSAR